MNDQIRAAAERTAHHILGDFGPKTRIEATGLIEETIRKFAEPAIPSRPLSRDEVEASLRAHVTREVQPLVAAAARALPLLVRLGDFVGNAGGRCEVILAVKDALEGLGLTPAEIAALGLTGAVEAKPPAEDDPDYARVRCHGDSITGRPDKEKSCGLVTIPHAQYAAQMARPNQTWGCPNCGSTATFDDEYWEARHLTPEERGQQS